MAAEDEAAILSKQDRDYLKSIRANAIDVKYSHKYIVKHKYIAASSIIYGHPYLPSVRKEGIDYLLNNYIPKSNYVFITSFPRSGTHWTMKICVEIIRNCSYNINLLPPEYKNADYRYIPHIEPMISKPNGINIFNTYLNRYNNKYKTFNFCFTHCPFYLFPSKSINKKTKIIHIVRNPKDTIVSYYHLNSYVGADSPTFNQFFDSFMNGIGFGGDWFNTFIEWYYIYKSNKYNILWLYYEDILENPQKEIYKIAQYLLKDEGNKYLNPKLINDKNVINHIANKCIFKQQKKTAKRGWKDIIIRKGVNNEWKKYFNQKQSQLIDEKIRVTFHESDIKYYKQLIIKAKL